MTTKTIILALLLGGLVLLWSLLPEWQIAGFHWNWPR